MDKAAQEALQKLQEQGVGEKGFLSATVTVIILRKWWVDNESPYRERWLFLDGISQDAHKTPFYVRAWWPIPLDDLSLFEALDKIPKGIGVTMSSSRCTIESGEDFYLDGEEQHEKGDDLPP